MSFLDPNPRQDDLLFSVVLVAVMFASFSYLVFGAGFESVYAGWGALVALPFAFGALVTKGSNFYSWLGCLGTPFALLGISVLFVALGIEGFVCVAMVMPFWIVAAIGGGLMSIWLKRGASFDAEEATSATGTRLKSVSLAVLPFAIMFIEAESPPEWQTRQVERSIIVERSKDDIWPLLVSIPDIGSDEGVTTFTHDWLRIPRPSDAQLIQQSGIIVRKAKWGDDLRFEEVITTLRTGQEISWNFAFPDDSVQKHTDRHISPDGPLLRIVEGRYSLAAIGYNRTRITLTTSYHMRTRLKPYFAFWGEILLGDVERNVLSIIKQRAEKL